MLGIEHRKGSLTPGTDADFVVLKEITKDGSPLVSLEVEEVWKFGVPVRQTGASVDGRSQGSIRARL